MRLFQVCVALCAVVIITAEKGENRHGQTVIAVEDIHKIVKRAFSFGDFVDDVEDALGSVEGAVKDAAKNTLTDAVGDADDVVGKAVDDVLDGILDQFGLDKETAKDVTDFLFNFTDSSENPATTEGSPTETTVGLPQSTDEMTLQTVQYTTVKPQMTTTNVYKTTAKPDRRTFFQGILAAPVRNFADQLRNFTRDRLTKVRNILSEQFIKEERSNSISNAIENRVNDRIDTLVDDLSSAVIGFVSNLTAQDLQFLNQIEHNETRRFMENYMEDILPTLVKVIFNKATFEELRCVITKNVLRDQFNSLFKTPEVSQLLTDLILSNAGCPKDLIPTNNANQEDPTLDRAAIQALTTLTTSRDANDVKAASSILDAISFANPSLLDPSKILETVTEVLSSPNESDEDSMSSLPERVRNLLRSGGALDIDSIIPNIPSINDKNEDKTNRSASRFVSSLLQPVLDPLPLSDDQKAVVALQVENVLVPLARSTLNSVGNGILTSVLTNTVKQLGLSDEQAETLTSQLENVIKTVLEPNKSSGGDSGEPQAATSPLSQLDLGSFQDILKTLSSSGLLPNRSNILSAEVQQALGLMSTISDAFTALSGIYSKRFDTSQRCQLERAAIGVGIETFQPWALTFLDALGKPGTGILQGNSYFVGDFDQCTGISHVTETGDVIGGTYAKYKFVMTLPAGFPTFGGAVRFQEGGLPFIIWGVCLPQGCTQQDAKVVGQSVADGLSIQMATAEILDRRDPTSDLGFICTMILFAILGTFCLIGTFLEMITTPHKIQIDEPEGSPQRRPVQSTISEDPATLGSPTGERIFGSGATFRDLSMREESGPPSPPRQTIQKRALYITKTTKDVLHNLFVAFSLIKNIKQLLTARHLPGEITCLHGIRVISITWVILGHTYIFTPEYGNLVALLNMSKWWTFNAIRNATYTVDTFFVIGGCLVSYLFLKAVKNAGGVKKKHLVLYYVYRYLRLTPLFVLAMLAYAFISPYVEYGPFQKEIYDRVTACKEKWWWNILYINNLFSESEVCIGWSWYLPNDVQFYALAPLIIVPLALGYRFVGLLVAFFQVGIHLIMFAYLEEKYDATLSKNAYAYFTYIYIKPYARCGPYAIGLVLGYILFSTKFKVKLHRFLVFAGWIVAIGGGLALVYVTHDNYYKAGVIKPEWTSDGSNAYEIVARPLWALCVAWVVFACCTGYGGVINIVLSWRAWIPLSRLTFGVYLFHVMVIHYFNNNERTLTFFTTQFITQRYVVVFVISYGVAFLASLLVETPIRNLTKPSHKKNKDNATTIQDQSPNSPKENGGLERTPNSSPTKVSFGQMPTRFGSNPYTSLTSVSEQANNRNTTVPDPSPSINGPDQSTSGQHMGQHLSGQLGPATAVLNVNNAGILNGAVRVNAGSVEDYRRAMYPNLMDFPNEHGDRPHATAPVAETSSGTTG